MKRNRKGETDGTRMELKYCEHCGGLWFREGSDPGVYCEECKSEIAELPPPKKKPGRVQLPVGQTPLVEEMEDWEIEDMEFEAAGGAA